MKINRLVSAIFFFVVGLFSLASLQAQEAKTLFVNIPDSLTPLLTKVNLEDCIDFLESKMKAQVENLSLIHISEPTRPRLVSRMPSSA